MKKRKLQAVLLSALFLFPVAWAVGTGTGWLLKNWPRVKMRRIDAGANGAHQFSPEKKRASAEHWGPTEIAFYHYDARGHVDDYMNQWRIDMGANG